MLDDARAARQLRSVRPRSGRCRTQERSAAVERELARRVERYAAAYAGACVRHGHGCACPPNVTRVGDREPPQCARCDRAISPRSTARDVCDRCAHAIGRAREGAA